MQYVIIIFFCTVLCAFYEVNVVTAQTAPSHGKVVPCYWTTWSTYRPGRGKFLLQDLDATLCTHLMFAFAHFNDTHDFIYGLANWADLELDEKNQNNVTKLKENYPHLKVMVALGGWMDGSIKYSKMAADAEKRSNFINDTIQFIKKYNLDGLDLYWQFPTKRGGSLHDKANFVQLIKEMREEYDQHDLLITAALGASKDTIDNGYAVAELSTHLHYMFMISYDYFGMWSRMTGPIAPLHGSNLLNVEYTINHMLRLGADPKKLILGVPTYGRSYLRLIDTNDTTTPRLGEKFNKTNSFKGPYTQEEGFIGYNEVCLLLSDGNWTEYWDEVSNTSFAVNGEELVSYENERSIREKVKFALDNNLGGVLLYTVDHDDFRGDCNRSVDGKNNYPLLRSIHKNIREYIEDQKRRPVNIKMPPHVSQVESSTSSISNSLLFIIVIFVIWCINKI